MTRKIIQITISDYKLSALCNDGTILIENGECNGWDIVDYKVPQPLEQPEGDNRD